MQLKKIDLRKKIVNIAREEFFIKGYEKTYMRSIAQKSGISLSNIYTYFKNKDEILIEVSGPLMTAIKDMMLKHNSSENISIDIFNSVSCQEETFCLFIELIKQYKQELRLLLFFAHGSSYQNFNEELIEYYTTCSYEYFKLMNDKYPYLNICISHFFIHSHCSSFVSIICELVSHEMNDEEIELFMSEYIEFNTAGWEKVMRIKHTNSLGFIARLF